MSSPVVMKTNPGLVLREHGYTDSNAQRIAERTDVLHVLGVSGW